MSIQVNYVQPNIIFVPPAWLTVNLIQMLVAFRCLNFLPRNFGELIPNLTSICCFSQKGGEKPFTTPLLWLVPRKKTPNFPSDLIVDM